MGTLALSHTRGRRSVLEIIAIALPYLSNSYRSYGRHSPNRNCRASVVFSSMLPTDSLWRSRFRDACFGGRRSPSAKLVDSHQQRRRRRRRLRDGLYLSPGDPFRCQPWTILRSSQRTLGGHRVALRRLPRDSAPRISTGYRRANSLFVRSCDRTRNRGRNTGSVEPLLQVIYLTHRCPRTERSTRRHRDVALRPASGNRI